MSASSVNVKVVVDGRIVTKYEALFAGTAGVRKWQGTLVEEARLHYSFAQLRSKIDDIVGDPDFTCVIDWKALTAGLRSAVDNACECTYEPQRFPFESFFDDVYSDYLSVMSHPHYFLSDIELLALAHCTRQNVVIFVHHVTECKLTYTRSYIADPVLPLVLTSLQYNGAPGAVRSHFERLRKSVPEELPAPVPDAD